MILAAVVLLFGAAVFFALKKGAVFFQARSLQKNQIVSITELWDAGDYPAVSRLAEERLSEDPMNRDALLFAGYSRFFLAISRLSAEKRLEDLDYSIFYLRLLKTRNDTPHPERVDYLLGKAYLLKGPYWADLAIRYLIASLEAGYLAEDSYEFLGRAYSSLGYLNAALDCYEKAAKDHPTDRLLLTMGEDAFQLGRYNEAESYYLKVIDETRDEGIRIKGLSQLGQLYYDVGNYSRAREVLEELVETEPGKAAHQFLLGETYHELGLSQKARAAWFKAVRIDPRHNGALKRLYD